MTRRIVGHLRGRIAEISFNMNRLKASIESSKHNITTSEAELMAYKVEKQTLTHALKEWEKEHD